MDSVKIRCDCGNSIDANVGDAIINDVYRWSLSFHCEKCGAATEIDGLGIEDLPDDIKKLIIKKYGKWAISLSNKKKAKYILTKMSLVDSIEIGNDNSEILVKGTENEMRWIGKQLENKKVTDYTIAKIQ